MLDFNKYFYKKKKSKLYFGERVAVLNDFIYQNGGSILFRSEAANARPTVNWSFGAACPY
jgi:hypothetical protein